MDSDTQSSMVPKMNFFQHVFNFDADTKSDLMNIVQYALLAIVPVVALNKGIGKVMPEPDDEKGSVELLAEVVGQVAVIFVGIFFIHRLVTYVPTYSGSDYKPLNVVNFIAIVLVILLSIQSKIGEKTNILIDRLMDLVMGRESLKPNDKHEGKGHEGHENQHEKKHAIHTLPGVPSTSGQQFLPGQTQNSSFIPPIPGQGPSLPSGGSGSGSSGQGPDFNAMYAGPTNHLVGAQAPGISAAMSEPMAANEAFGGFGGSSF